MIRWLTAEKDPLIGEELFESKVRPIFRRSEAYLESAVVDIAREMFQKYETFRHAGDDKKKAIDRAIAEVITTGKSVMALNGNIAYIVRDLLETLP